MGHRAVARGKGALGIGRCVLDRRGSRRWDAPPGANIPATESCVILGGRNLGDRCPFGNRLLKEFLQKWAAPPATGPRSETIAQLRRSLRFLHAQIIDNLATGDVKAQADFLIKVFHNSPGLSISFGAGGENQTDPARQLKLCHVQTFARHMRIHLSTP